MARSLSEATTRVLNFSTLRPSAPATASWSTASGPCGAVPERGVVPKPPTAPLYCPCACRTRAMCCASARKPVSAYGKASPMKNASRAVFPFHTNTATKPAAAANNTNAKSPPTAPPGIVICSSAHHRKSNGTIFPSAADANSSLGLSADVVVAMSSSVARRTQKPSGYCALTVWRPFYCTAPGSLDTRERSDRAISGAIQIAPPLRKIDPGASTALGGRVGSRQEAHAALPRASARACVGVRWPKRSMSQAVL
jgi:hypothetical protein